jgi:hypothetical protein
MNNIIILLFVLSLVGFYLYGIYFKRNAYHDNCGRRSGRSRRKSFDANKNHMRRSDRDRRSQPDRRKFSRAK